MSDYYCNCSIDSRVVPIVIRVNDAAVAEYQRLQDAYKLANRMIPNASEEQPA